MKELLKSDSQSYALMGKGPFFDSQCIYAVSVSCIMSITTQNALKVHVTQLVFIYFYHTKHNTKGFESYTSNIWIVKFSQLDVRFMQLSHYRRRHQVLKSWGTKYAMTDKEISSNLVVILPSQSITYTEDMHW